VIPIGYGLEKQLFFSYTTCYFSMLNIVFKAS
jgi:hypothetical protein